MSGQKKTSLARIRTYAQDLDEQRKKLAPHDAQSEVHTVPAETIVVSKPKPVIPATAPATRQPESKTIFPPQEKAEKIVQPHHTVTQQATTATPTTKHIPAFHELQHELQNNINPKKPDTTPFSQPYNKPAAPKISVRNKNKPAASPKDAIALSGGTVITDTKRADFSLIGAIIGSVVEFFHSIADQFNKPKAPPKYTVTAPERRKGVIQKATSKTGTIFTADNETLKEEILRRRREQAAKPEISWSPNTEVGYPLLEEPEIESEPLPTPASTPSPVPRFSIPDPVHTEPTPTEDDLRWSQRTYVPPPPPKIDIAPPTPPVVAPEPKIVTPPTPPLPPPVVEPVVVPPQPTPAPQEPAQVATPKQKRSWLARFKNNTPSPKRASSPLSTINSNVLAVTIVGVIAGVVILSFATRSLLIVLSPQSGEVSGEMKAPLITADRNGTILFTPGSVNSVEQIVNAGVSTTGTGITEIRFLDTNQVELSPQTLFSLFGFQTNPNFNQSVTTLRLLSLDGQARGFVFEVTDPTTVFGAMLEWERNIYTDLGELLSLPVTQPESGRFIDRTIGQSDVRILVVNGEEILIYGFIDANLLLITSDSTQFTRILQSR